MKVLHLTTSLSGGAGIAARSICQAQIDFGVDALIMGGLKNKKSGLASNELVIGRSSNQKIRSSLVTYLQGRFVQKSDYLVTPVSINTLNINDSRIRDSDIVNIHSFYNLLSIQKIMQLAKKKPVVVTLHDQRFFTGGCHYSFDCNQYKSSCKKCPQVGGVGNIAIQASFREALVNLKTLEGIYFITPSNWLMNMAEESFLLRNSRMEVINNPIPPIFRKILGLSDPKRFTVGFVSESLNNPYKGISTLVQALNLIAKNRELSLRVFGTGKIPPLDPNVNLEYSRFDNDIESVAAFNMCDVVVIPSIQDNSPSVLSEAIMCGVPVIASQVGGITELLTQFGLPGFPPGDFKKLAKLIDAQASQRFTFPALQSAESYFSYPAVASRYLAAYERAIG